MTRFTIAACTLGLFSGLDLPKVLSGMIFKIHDNEIFLSG